MELEEAVAIVRDALHGTTERNTVTDVRPALARLDRASTRLRVLEELAARVLLSAGPRSANGSVRNVDAEALFDLDKYLRVPYGSGPYPRTPFPGAAAATVLDAYGPEPQ
jgi:hypothetical protein